MNLPRRLDVSAGLDLRAEFMRRRGAPLELDASEVESASGLALEIIVAAARQWDADGHAFALHRPSEGFSAVCRTLGLEPTAPWRVLAPAEAGA